MVSNDATLKPFKCHNGPLLVRSVMVGYRTESKTGHNFDLESFLMNWAVAGHDIESKVKVTQIKREITLGTVLTWIHPNEQGYYGS